jgi:hypothetical protein
VPSHFPPKQPKWQGIFKADFNAIQGKGGILYSLDLIVGFVFAAECKPPFPLWRVMCLDSVATSGSPPGSEPVILRLIASTYFLLYCIIVRKGTWHDNIRTHFKISNHCAKKGAESLGVECA